MTPRIARVEAAATRELRAAVLRPGRAVEGPLQGDDAPGTVALGAFRPRSGSGGGDELVGCCLLVPEAAPAQTGVTTASGWRLRGMAVVPEHRGGTGGALLASALEAVAEEGGGVLWCHARVAARRLYERAGLVVVGEVFEEIGIPHVLMWRPVAPSRPAARPRAPRAGSAGVPTRHSGAPAADR